MKNLFKKIRGHWKKYSKKRKTALISILFLILALIGLLIVYITTFTKEETKTVILKKDNFIYKDGFLYFLDEDNNKIGSYECQNKSPKLCMVAIELNEDNFDVEKNVYQDNTPVPIRSKIYNREYVFITDKSHVKDEEVILYDMKTKEKINTYKGLKGAEGNKYDLTIVKNNDDKYSLIDLNDKEIKTKIDFNYDYMGIIDVDQEKAIVKENDKYYLINYDNKKMTPEITGIIKSFNNKYIVVENENLYQVVDYKNKKVLGDFVYAKLYDELVATIDTSNKLMIVDYENAKMMADSISLTNMYYNQTNIFDKKNHLKESNQAFTINIKDSEAKLTIFKDNEQTEKSINLNEGIVNKGLNYYSYFDGKLYFYSDENKEKLLGLYECDNSNNITSKKDILKNCFIAKDNNTEASTGIYSSRFVFIYDSKNTTPSQKDLQVKLFDIKSKKLRGEYISVNTQSNNDNVFVTDDNTYIIAKNDKLKYGLLKINGSNASKTIAFEYDEFKILNSAEIKVKKDNKYMIIDYSGKEQKNCYKGNYYYSQNSDKKYSIHQFSDDKQVINGTFANVSLYDDFAIVINDSKILSAYSYSNQQLITEKIAVKSVLDFNVSNQGETVVIEANNKSYIYDTTNIPWVLTN